MRGRIRIAAAGLAAMTVIGVMSSSAGADTSTWNAKANAGSIDITILGHSLELAGGTTEADANSTNVANALGLGLCVTNGTPCPIDVTSPTGQNFSTLQSAHVNGANQSSAPGLPAVCAGPPLPLVLVTVSIGCGNASASEVNGLPTAEGDGSLLGATINVTMGSALSTMGIALPSAANAPCNGVTTPAATTTPGSGSGALPPQVQNLLGTVNNTLTGNLGLPPLQASTVSTNSQQAGDCSVFSGLANSVAGIPVLGPLVAGLVNGTSLNDAMGTSLLSVAAVESKSTIASSTGANGDPIETAKAIGDGLDVNVMNGMFDLKVIPAVATATVDQTTGKATTDCTPGLIEVTANGGTPNLVSAQSLGDALNSLLSQLDATPLGTLLDALLQVPDPKNFNCDQPQVSGNTTSVTGGEINDVLIPAAMGGLLGIHVNDVTATVSGASAATPASNPTTQPSQNPSNTPAAAPAATPVAAAAPAAVPNVTSVHTGEFWAGTLPVILMIGMALAGSLLIGRRRVMSFARSIPSFARRMSGR